MKNADLLRSHLHFKIASERSRLCPNITQEIIGKLGEQSPSGQFRDQLLLWKCFDEFYSALSCMIDGDEMHIIDFFSNQYEIDMNYNSEIDEYAVSSNNELFLHNFLKGDWQPNYSTWLIYMQSVYPSEDRLKIINEEIDDGARDYQVCWEKKYGRPWPSPKKS